VTVSKVLLLLLKEGKERSKLPVFPTIIFDCLRTGFSFEKSSDDFIEQNTENDTSETNCHHLHEYPQHF
jgi:hypothetical protein